MRVRGGVATLATAVLLPAFATPFLSTPARAVPLLDQASALSGVARDAVGRVLSGVEILVLADGRAGAVVTSVVTDDHGRFRIPDLPPGLYRLAAIKPGYLAQVSRVNTFLKTSFDLVLRPVPRPGEPGSENVAPDLSWMLRVPKRSLLHDTDPEDILREAAVVASSLHRRIDVPAALAAVAGPGGIDGEVRHLVALSSRAGEGGSNGPVVGGETSMRLSSPIGPRGSIRLAGRKESLEAEGRMGLGLSPGRRDDASVSVGFNYDTGPDESIEMSAYWSERDLRYASGVPDVAEEGGGLSREGHRSWGYDATWTKQLDAASRVAVQFGYVDASLEVPADSLAAVDGAASLRTNVSNRSVGAEGVYEGLAGDAHQVRVGVQARMLDLALPWVRSGNETTFLGLPGAAGLSLRIDAQDAWGLTPGFTAVYGLGVQQALEGREATLVVPRAGGVWNLDRVQVGVGVAYHSVVRWGGTPVADPVLLQAEDAFEPARPWGYSASVEVPALGSLRVRGEYRFEPVREADGLREQDRVSVYRPMFASGSRASDRRASLSVEHGTARAKAFAEVVSGRAEGLLSQASASDLPVLWLAERALEYRSGKVGARFAPTGTDVSLEYRRFEEGAVEGVPASPVEPIVSGYYELLFGQQVARFRSVGASCRVVVAARVSRAAKGAADDSAEAERMRTIAALNRRLSAGVLVTF